MWFDKSIFKQDWRKIIKHSQVKKKKNLELCSFVKEESLVKNLGEDYSNFKDLKDWKIFIKFHSTWKRVLKGVMDII